MNNQFERGTVNRLTEKERKAAFRRWTFVAGLGWNYETQQAPSVAFAMSKALRKIYPNDEDYIEAMDNHFKYFNITPQMGNLVLGATLAMEEQDGLKAKGAVQNLKISLMGPLSGVGDSLFWVLWPTIIGGISGYMALQGNPIGAIIWIIVSVALYFVKMALSNLGYSSGTKLITTLGDKINLLTDAASVMGLMVVGTLIATHSTLAEGFANALKFFAGDDIDVTYINAYVDGKPIDEEIDSYFSTLKDEDELVILTDLLAGSVNQKLYKYISREHTHILTGTNLALALSLVLESADGYLTNESINGLVKASRENIVYMNEFQAEVDDDDE